MIICSQHAVKGRHLYVSRPQAGGTFLINASFVDVSDVLIHKLHVAIYLLRLRTCSDLCSACCPQGYHAPRAFIAAQSPMKTTVDDFWTLIAEKRVQTALLLCQLVEDSQVSSTCSSLYVTCVV